jgi:hypothetical protein
MQTATINVKVDTAQAQKSINTLNQSINQFGGSAASLKTELRQTIQELQNLQPGSARFQELSIKAGELRDQIADTNAVVGQLAGNMAERLTRGITGVVSIGVAGFQTLAASVALFGGESEELQKTMVKLQALMNLSQALETFSGLDQKIVEIRASFQSLTVATNTQTIAQEGENIATAQGTVATTALGVAMKALPIIAIVAAIGTLVYGIYQYVSANEEATKQEEKRKKELESAKKAQEAQNNAIKEGAKLFAGQISGFISLTAQVRNSLPGSKERLKLIKDLNSTYGTTIKNLKDEKLFQDQVTKSISDYIAYARVKFRLQASEKSIEDQFARQEVAIKKLATETGLLTDAQRNYITNFARQVQAGKELGGNLDYLKAGLFNQKKEYQLLAIQVQDYIGDITQSNTIINGYGLTIDKLNKEINNNKNALFVAAEQTKDHTDVVDKDTKAIEENVEARKTYNDTINEIIDTSEALTQKEEEILKVRQQSEKLSRLQGEAIAEVEKNRANGIYKTAEAYKNALNSIKTNEEELLQSQLEIIKKEGEARSKAKQQSGNVKIGGGGEDPKEKEKQKKREEQLKAEMDLVKKNFDQQIKDLDSFNKFKENEITRINEKYLAQTELFNLELQKIQLDSQQQEKLNLAGSEEEKLEIRKSYADKILQNEIDIINKQKEIQVSNIKISEEEKAKIIAESENKILKLREKSIDDTVTTTEEKFDIFTEMRMAFAENNDEFQKNWSENWITTLQDLVGEIAQITGQITDLFSQAFQVAADNQLASLERLTAQEQEQLNASLVNREITDKQYEEKKKLLEKSAEERKKQIEIKEFRRQKALNIVNAVMNTALGVTKALPNPILMALAAVLGIAQVAIISAQQFRAAQGGVVPQNGQSGNVDSVPSLLAPGEVVINSQSSQMFPQLLSDINQAGGGKRLVPEVAFTNPYNQTNVFQPQQQMVQAYVVESQITNSQRRISRMERAASF